MNIQEKTIIQLHEALLNKETTSRELVLEYLSRIAKYDQSKYGLNSVLEINADALFLADKFDAENNKPRSLLHGIPIMLKDNINTADKMHTSAGSLALGNNFAPYDAFIVKKLRKAGAIILGKTNMTEFASFMTNEMPSGYSSRGGQVLCPYDKNENPSGSSAGSAVAVSANLCSVSIGTETSGSIITPAIINGIVGIKPTLGLVSRHGIIPISNTLDTAGPMARTVEDAAILLSIIAGNDENDTATLGKLNNNPIDYMSALKKDGLKGMRIGVNRAYQEHLHEDVNKTNKTLLNVLKKAGAIIIDDLYIDGTNVDFDIMEYEFKLCINSYLSTLSNNYSIHTLSDIIDFNNNNTKQTLNYGQSSLLKANNRTDTLTDPKYLEALAQREVAIKSLDKLMDENQLDVIFCVTSSNIAASTGFPCMTIPITSTDDGMSIGSFWMARRFDEASLLRATYSLEKIINARLEPIL